MAKNLGEMLVRLSVDTKTWKRNLSKMERDWRRTGRQLHLSGMQLTRSVTLPILGIGAAAIKSFADFERLEVALTQTVGSASQAKVELQQIAEIAKQPGIGYEQALQAATSLRAMGESAEFTQSTLSGFAKAVALSGGTAENFQSVLVQMRQTLATGLIDRQSFKIIQEQLPKGLEVMREKFGSTNIELIRASYSAREFWEIMIDGMNALPQPTETTANALNNFYTSLKKSMSQLGGAIVESTGFNEILNTVSRSIDTATRRFENMSKSQQQATLITAGFAAALGPATAFLGNLAVTLALAPPALKNFINLLQGVGKLLKWVTSLAGLLATAVTILTWKFKDQIREVWEKLPEWLQVVASFFSPAGALMNGTSIMADYWDRWTGSLRDVNKELEKTVFSMRDLEKTTALLYQTGMFENLLGTLSAKQFPGPYAPAGGTGTKAKKGGGTGTKTNKGAGERDDTMQKLLEVLWGLEKMPTRFIAAQEPLERLTAGVDGFRTVIAAAMTEAGEFAEEFVMKMRTMADVAFFIQDAFTSLGDAVGQAFTDIATGQATFGEAMGKAWENIKKRVISSLAAMIAKALAAIAVFGILAVLSGGVGAVATGAKNLLSIMGGLKGILTSFIGIKFGGEPTAKGGIFYGPSNRLVGEYPGARSNPEVIAPLDKLKSMIGDVGGGIRGELTARVSGQDLLFILRQANDRAGKSGRSTFVTLSN